MAFFEPLKIKWRKVFEEWKEKYHGPVPLKKFSRLLKKCLDILQSSISQNLMSGLELGGIYPESTESVVAHAFKK